MVFASSETMTLCPSKTPRRGPEEKRKLLFLKRETGGNCELRGGYRGSLSGLALGLRKGQAQTLYTEKGAYRIYTM